VNGIKVASVWIQDLLQWVPLSQIGITKFFTYEGRSCVEFKFENQVITSYVEYKEQ
jgi:hypothetical protein